MGFRRTSSHSRPDLTKTTESLRKLAEKQGKPISNYDTRTDPDTGETSSTVIHP